MKKILFLVALVVTTISQTFAQKATIQATPILAGYYNIKDALVSGIQH